MATTATAASLIEAVKGIAPIISEHADRSEREHRLADETVDAMKRAGFFRMCKPRSHGGLEVDPITAIRVIEEVGRIDVSAAWNLFLSSTGVPFYQWIPAKGVEEYLSGDPDSIIAGAVFPPGMAIPVEGGYRITGRWPFCSGCQHADWLIETALIYDGEEPRRGEDGNPLQAIFSLPAADVRILDTWNTIGMCGTGSHDVVVADCFVPASRFGLLGPVKELREPLSGPLYRFGHWLAVASLPSVGLGCARGALDALLDLGSRKTPAYGASTLARRPSAQAQLGRAEALLGAARAYLFETVSRVYDTACRGEMPASREKIDIQLAASHAVESAAEVVNLVHQAAGTSAIRRDQPFERRFRDIHTLTQHAFTSINRYESVGRMLFGQPTDWPFLAL